MTANTRNRPHPRTAAAEHSIWQDTGEDSFRRHLVALEERTNAIPIKLEVFGVLCDIDFQEPRILSFKDEQALADDFAYLAAVGEGAQSVAAVCIEERVSPQGLHLQFAAADTILGSLQVSLEEVGRILMSIAQADTTTSVKETSSSLLSVIVHLHTQKLHGRLRSIKWQKPAYLSRTHKKPLWQDLDNVMHRVQHVYPKTRDQVRARIFLELQSFQKTLKDFEDTQNSSMQDQQPLLHVVRASYNLCQSTVIREFTTKLEDLPKATQQVSAALKTIHQIEKIGAYQRISQDLVRIAKRYPILFGDIRFGYLEPYAALPTDIGYEDWAKSIHVHAEVQLIVHYDLQQQESQGKSTRAPRTIGTSKYLCYLCYLFMKHHDSFNPLNTHGRLYDQWTVPDLEEFTDATRERYKLIIKDMDDEIVALTESILQRRGKREAWRAEPMTSRQNLLHYDAEYDHGRHGSESCSSVAQNSLAEDVQLDKVASSLARFKMP